MKMTILFSNGWQLKNCSARFFLKFFPSYLLFVGLFSFQHAFSQLTINTNVTALQLVKSIMARTDSVSNIKLMAPAGSIGTFNNISSNIGMQRGILLTSGKANIANGTNNDKGAGVNNDAPGDEQLDQLSGAATLDACVLEFDFIPTRTQFTINYIFASEEYPEYVGQDYNDVFAFFISGPGITGIQNIAVVPGTTIPVSIATINADVNSNYFVNNTNGNSIQYDGFTKSLPAVVELTPFATYHVKLAIADGTDGLYDSGVFIGEGGTASVPKVTSPFTSFKLYPNPSSEKIHVSFNLSANQQVNATVVDISGRQVLILKDALMPAGLNTVDANIEGLAKGLYFVKLIIAGAPSLQKLKIE